MDWAQLKAVLWLRWRLTRNQWAKGGGVGAILAGIVAAAVVVLSVSSFLGGIAVGALALSNASPMVMLVIWLILTAGFLFMWLIGLLQDLQRSETIDLQRLMHLPVALGQIFVVNYVASHLAVSIVLFVPAMVGLAIGLAISRGPAMLLMLPLSLGMVAMVTAWTYYLRGRLAALMSNPRRRRAIIMGVSAAVILLVQAPNIYFNVLRRGDRPRRSADAAERAKQREAENAAEREQVAQLLKYQVAIPPLWVTGGAHALAEGRPLPALLGTIGCLGLAAIGLRRAYRSTLRFYQGESGGKAAARPPTAPPTRHVPAAQVQIGRLFLERRLPGVPEQAAALALMTFRSMLRAPEVKMQWGMSFVATLAVTGMVLFRSAPDLSPTMLPFALTGGVVFSLFLMVQFLTNQFGFDRDGFRTLVLSPVDRDLILLGKNLAALPIGAAFAFILVLVVAVWLRLSPLLVLAAACQLIAGLLIGGLGGNLLSILMPYRIQAGSLKPTKLPGLTMVVLVVSQLMVPVAMAPLFVPPLVGMVWERLGGPPATLVNLALSAALAIAMVFIYRRALDPIGRLLQRRETRIISAVTVDVD